MTERKQKSKAEFYAAREAFLLALAQADVTPAALRVGLVLGTRFNSETWETDPSVERLMQMTGADRRTVQRGIASLREARVIDIVEGRGQGNRHVFRLPKDPDKRRQDCRLLEDHGGRQDCRLLEDEKAASLAAKGGNFGRERRQDCRPDTIETPSGTQGAAASSGGPPMATVSPTSAVVEDTRRDAQTGEAARADRAPPPPDAAEEDKPKYPKDWADGLSKAAASAELQVAAEQWRRLLDDCEDRQAIQRALWRYCNLIHLAKARGEELPRVPPPSEWFRDRWDRNPQWWGLPSEASRRTSTSTFHGG